MMPVCPTRAPFKAPVGEIAATVESLEEPHEMRALRPFHRGSICSRAWCRGDDAGTRNRQIGLRQSNGQVVGISYDQNTQVVYQNQSYPVTSLENGDQVTLRLQQTNNGGYYTDLVQVDQSVRNTGGSVYQSGNVQMLEGNVRGVNRQQGFFTLNLQSGAVITVQLPSQVNRNDLSRFNSLRAGDYVRFYGVAMGNSNVELRQFQ